MPNDNGIQNDFEEVELEEVELDDLDVNGKRQLPSEENLEENSEEKQEEKSDQNFEKTFEFNLSPDPRPFHEGPDDQEMIELDDFSLKTEPEFKSDTGAPEDQDNFEIVIASKLTPKDENTQTNTQTLHPFLSTPKDWLSLIAVLPGAMMNGVNAFLFLPGIKPQDVSWETLSKISKPKLILAIMMGLSSLGINTAIGYAGIYRAIELFLLQMTPAQWEKHPLKNFIISLLSIGSAITAASISITSLFFAGRFIAYTNAFSNGTLFGITRFYGLVNALRRFEKWYSHRFDANIFVSNTFDDLLAHLKPEYIAILNAKSFLREANEINEYVVAELLKELDSIIKDHPDALINHSATEYLAKIFDISFALYAGSSIVPLFVYRCLDGLIKMGIPVDKLSPSVQIPIGLGLSLATPILYVGQIMLLREVLLNACLAMTDSEYSSTRRHKNQFKGLLLAIANILASPGLYNLIRSATHEKNWPFRFLIPPDSKIETANKITAAIAGCSVNSKLTFDYFLPAPPTHKSQKHNFFLPTSKSFTLPKIDMFVEEKKCEAFTVTDVHKWLKHHHLNKPILDSVKQNHLEVIEEKDRGQRAPTPNLNF